MSGSTNISKVTANKIPKGEMYKNGLFIFRRDLRIVDNIGLNLLNTKCKNIYTIFIFTPEQVSDKNKYKSEYAVQFMIECLEVLSDDIKKKMEENYIHFMDQIIK